MIGCFLGGAYAGLMHVYAYAVAGSVGFLALPVFIGSDAMNLVHTIISIALTCVSTFILGIKFGYKTKEEI
jgi:PTS system beta-glucosides-specific IIC component